MWQDEIDKNAEAKEYGGKKRPTIALVQQVTTELLQQLAQPWWTFQQIQGARPLAVGKASPGGESGGRLLQARSDRGTRPFHSRRNMA